MLRKREFLRPALLVGAMVVVLVGAYYAEKWLRQLRLVAQADFEFAPYVWATALSNLVLAVIVLSLIWYVLQSDPADLIVAVVYLVVGGFVALNPVLHLIYRVRLLPSEAALTFAHGPLVTAGAFFAAAGLIGLFLSLSKR